MKYRSLKKDYISNFIFIIVLTMIFYIATLFIWFYIMPNYQYAANYFELQIPDILNKIDYNNILKAEYKSTLDNIIPSKGISYLVYDINGNLIYGNESDNAPSTKSSKQSFDNDEKLYYSSIKENIIIDKKSIYENINRSISNGNNYFSKISPIIDNENNLIGALLLQYQLKAMPLNNNNLYKLINIFVLLSPILFLILFTIIFSKRFGKKITEPVELLINASENIQNENLDFKLQYDVNNELGELVSSFNSMKDTLESSLLEQWKLEENRKENLRAVAHDLKTPLSIVRTYSESLLDSNLDNKTAEYIETINRNNERAIILIDNINRVTNIEGNSFKLEPKEVNINDFIYSKLNEIEILLNNKNIEFINKVNILSDKNIGNYDILAIEEIIDNIISNAIRYTGSNGMIRMIVDIKEDRLSLSISNSNSIFSPSDLDNLFVRFYKGDSSRSFNTGESGLGLYISKNLVLAHGGDINGENDNMGANINFYVKEIL